MGDLEGKTINIRIIGGSVNKGEHEETHGIGRKKVFWKHPRTKQKHFFQGRALNGGGGDPMDLYWWAQEGGWGGCIFIIHFSL